MDRNERNLARQNKQNEDARNTEIQLGIGKDRRTEREADVFKWLVGYFPKAFYREFTDQQRAIAEEILACIQEGRTQAIAAPRGSGKSVIARRVILYAILTGMIRFAVIVAATGRDAKGMLREIKRDLAGNSDLRLDYPEVCRPIWEVARSPRKCALQKVNGRFTDIAWQPEQIKLPTVEGSKSSGAKIYARSLDGSIRGLNEDDERPDFVLVDDPETRESAKSDVQVSSRRLTIDQDLSGLSVQGEPLGMLMLTTIQTLTSLSMEFTDPLKRPAWNGKRWKAIEFWPTNKDQWDEYILLRKDDQGTGDKKFTASRTFYETNREAMDAGAVLANEHAKPPGCLSALQGLYDFIADKGLDAFLTEYQNDPPVDTEAETNQLTDLKVLSKATGPQRLVMPGVAKWLTATIDLGKYACHWQVTAWLENDAGFVIDYGVQEVVGTQITSDKVQIDAALLSSLRTWRETMLAADYCSDQGEIKQVNVAMVDSGEFTDAVYQFVLEAGGPFCCSKGMGDTYKTTEIAGRQNCNHYYINHVPAGGNRAVPLYHLDTNFWKQRCHDAWLTPTLNEDSSCRGGAMTLFAVKTKTEHHSYAKHITAEEFTETFLPGKGLKRMWQKKNKNNHWLDTCYMSFAAREEAKRRERAARNRVKQAAPMPQGYGNEVFPGLSGISFSTER